MGISADGNLKGEGGVAVSESVCLLLKWEYRDTMCQKNQYIVTILLDFQLPGLVKLNPGQVSSPSSLSYVNTSHPL